MKVHEVIKYYGTKRKVADVLGVRYQAVQNWEVAGFVPEGRQWQIQALTAGMLTVDKHFLKRAATA